MRKLYPNLSKGRYDQLTEEIAAARRSLYFWWWRYLRLSSDYWWLCQQDGKTSDKAFAAVYGDFGDVFKWDFDKWWRVRGTNIFAYKLDPPKISFIDNESFDRVFSSRGMYKVAIPMYQTKAEIFKQLHILLQDHKPLQIPRYIASDHEVGDLRGMRRKVLLDMHRVWCLNDAVQRGICEERLDRPQRFTQQWMGQKLGVLPNTSDKKNRTPKVDANERLAIRVKVNRYLSKANLLIKNVEIGKFPSFESVPEVKRWTKKQIAEKYDAMSHGAWTCPESASDEVMALLK